MRELAEDVGDDRARQWTAGDARRPVLSPRTRVREGDTIDVAVAVDAVHVFDPATGVAIAAG